MPGQRARPAVALQLKCLLLSTQESKTQVSLKVSPAGCRHLLTRLSHRLCNKVWCFLAPRCLRCATNKHLDSKTKAAACSVQISFHTGGWRAQFQLVLLTTSKSAIEHALGSSVVLCGSHSSQQKQSLLKCCFWIPLFDVIVMWTNSAQPSLSAAVSAHLCLNPNYPNYVDL